MKRQFYLDDVERDLIRSALELWKHRLLDLESNVGASAHIAAKHFTVRRIDELLIRMQEPSQGD
jgi:hypothetical protein